MGKQNRHWIWVMLALGIILILSGYAYMTEARVYFFLGQRAQQAQSQWEASDIDSYHMVFSVSAGLPVRSLFGYSITVENTQVVSLKSVGVYPGADFTSESPIEDWAMRPKVDVLPGDLSQYTVDSLLNSIVEYTAQKPAIYFRTCNDSPAYTRYYTAYGEFGYPVEFSLRDNMCGVFGEESGVDFYVYEFEVLEE